MVIGQLASVTAAAYTRSGQLIPLLVQHTSDHASYFVYFGSRTAQPARARAFIDLAFERLSDSTEFMLNEQELIAAEKIGREAFGKRVS